MNGKIFVGAIIATTVIFGVSLWYNTNFAYYEKQTDITEVAAFGEVLTVSNYNGINANTSPLKLRACFDLELAEGAYSEFQSDGRPLIAPFWFRCFDAEQLTNDIEMGKAQVLLAAKNSPFGFTRYIAHYADGRAFMWRQINECGDAKFAGDPMPEGCIENDMAAEDDKAAEVVVPEVDKIIEAKTPPVEEVVKTAVAVEPPAETPPTRSITPPKPAPNLIAATEVIRLEPLIGDGPAEIETGPVTLKSDNADPLSLHGCFAMAQSFGLLTETYVTAEPALPVNVPGGLTCFDAEQLVEDLQIGYAIAFWGERNITPGVDRLVAVYDDGRAFVWHQENVK